MSGQRRVAHAEAGADVFGKEFDRGTVLHRVDLQVRGHDVAELLGIARLLDDAQQLLGELRVVAHVGAELVRYAARGRGVYLGSS